MFVIVCERKPLERIVFLDRSAIKASLRAPVFAHEWRDYAEAFYAPVDSVAGAAVGSVAAALASS